MSVPDFQMLMLPVLHAVADGPVTAPELRDKVATRLSLTPAELGHLLPSGRQTTFANRIAWANVFLQRAGLIDRIKRGVYQISPDGHAVLKENPTAINIKYLERFPSFTKWRSDYESSKNETSAEPTQEHDDTTATPEEQIADAFVSLTNELQTELLDRIREMSPAFFEVMVVDLLIAMGYGGGRAEMGKAVGRSGDGGIDGIIKEDALGLDVVYMQAKRYAADIAIGRPDIQSFAGSLDGVRATKGIFITTSSFTGSAKEFVDKINKRIVLIDGAELARLLIRHNVGVRIRESYEIKRVDEDYFTE